MLKPRNKVSFGFVTLLHARLAPSETLVPLGVYIWLQLRRSFFLLRVGNSLVFDARADWLAGRFVTRSPFRGNFLC